MKHFQTVPISTVDNKDIRTLRDYVNTALRIANEYPGREIYEDFRLNGVGATTAATKMTRGLGTIAAQDAVIVTKPSILHTVSLYCASAVTGGNAQVFVYVNTVAITPALSITSGQFVTEVFDRSIYELDPGDIVELYLATNALTATTADFRGILELVSQGVL